MKVKCSYCSYDLAADKTILKCPSCEGIIIIPSVTCNLPHDILKNIVEVCGVEIFSDVLRLQGILADAVRNKLIIKVIVLAVNDNIHNKLKNSTNSESAIKIESLKYLFSTQNFLYKEIANYIVDSFAYSLGIIKSINNVDSFKINGWFTDNSENNNFSAYEKVEFNSLETTEQKISIKVLPVPVINSVVKNNTNSNIVTNKTKIGVGIKKHKTPVIPVVAFFAIAAIVVVLFLLLDSNGKDINETPISPPVDSTAVVDDTIKGQPAPIPQEDTVYIAKDTTTDVPKPMPVKTATSKTYSFGSYRGDLKNGIPEGDGTMTYTRRVQIAKHDTQNPAHYAEAGDYFVGSWGNGDIVSGTLFTKDGVIRGKILAPKRFNEYDLSKD